jgi:hypothetical protein
VSGLFFYVCLLFQHKNNLLAMVRDDDETVIAAGDALGIDGDAF